MFRLEEKNHSQTEKQMNRNYFGQGMSAGLCNRPGCPHFPAGICPASPCGPNGDRLPADSMGYSVQPYQNPMQLYDDQGWGVPFTQHPTFMAPIFLNVESARRDLDKYANPSSFRVHLPHKLSGIRSIELVQLIVPTIADGGTAPLDDYFFLYNGLYDAQNNSFQPQGVLKMYETLNMEHPKLYNVENTIANNVNPTIKDPTNTTSPEYTGADITKNGVASSRPGAGAFPTRYAAIDFSANSFGKFCYNSSQPVQCWERSNWRRVQYFKPEMENLGHLDFTLVDRLGNLYDLDAESPDSNWAATLMLTCRSK